jgi:hypothetical protein
VDVAVGADVGVAVADCACVSGCEVGVGGLLVAVGAGTGVLVAVGVEVAVGAGRGVLVAVGVEVAGGALGVSRNAVRRVNEAA